MNQPRTESTGGSTKQDQHLRELSAAGLGWVLHHTESDADYSAALDEYDRRAEAARDARE